MTVRSRGLLQIRETPFSGPRARAAHPTARQTCGASIAATTATAATTTATSAASATAVLVVVLARSPDAALSELGRHCDHQEGHTSQRQDDHPAQTRAGHDRTLRRSAPAA
jgi:hypothetical protein